MSKHTQDNQGDLVYIGTYTGQGAGIYVARLDRSTGALQITAVVPEQHPSFLAIHPDRRTLYAVQEVADYQDEPTGAVSAYAIDQATGHLTLRGRQPSHGAHPCYLSLDPAGRHLFVANYSGGSAAVLPVQPDGSLGPATDYVQHVGASGAHPQRQAAPHPHSALPDPQGSLLLVPDLGQDQVRLYRLDQEPGRLVPHTPPALQAPPGAGPRHLAFHPGGRYLYLIHELDSTVTAFVYTGGALTPLQTVSTLPAGFAGENTGADLHLHPSGRFLYASNRGHDSLAIYAVDQATGRLTPQGYQSTQGRTPRHFAVDPSGGFLLAANQHSGTVVTFRIDPETGALAPTGQVATIPDPVCVTFLPPA